MMGKKRLSTVRAEVRAAFEAEGLDAEEWLTREIRKLERRRKPKRTEIETLKLLQKALARAAVEHA